MISCDLSSLRFYSQGKSIVINLQKITIQVGTVGIEPTCDQLPFLLLIRRRGYIPKYERLIINLINNIIIYLSQVIPEGFEPSTLGLEDLCSSN